MDIIWIFYNARIENKYDSPRGNDERTANPMRPRFPLKYLPIKA